MIRTVQAAILALVLLAIVFGALIATTFRAPAQPLACAPWSLMKANLLKTFKEAPIGAGPTKDGKAATVVLASPGGAAFTVVIVDRAGIACMIAAGVDWTVDAAAKAGEQRT